MVQDRHSAQEFLKDLETYGIDSAAGVSWAVSSLEGEMNTGFAA